MADGGIDFNEMVRRIRALPDLLGPGDYARVGQALHDLRDLPFPPGYLDQLRDDMYTVLRRGQQVTTYVYLSFYGLSDRASHLKIGIAKSVKSRLSGARTDNPMPRLFTYTARFPSREDAATVETALLQHMAAAKVHGEWVHVQGLSEQASEAMAKSLGEVASGVHGYPVHFDRHGA